MPVIFSSNIPHRLKLNILGVRIYEEGQTSLEDAVEKMVKHAATYLILVDDKRSLKGILTRSDIIERHELLRTSEGLSTPVKEIASTIVKTISVDSLHEAPSILIANDISHLPVVEKRGEKEHIVGMITDRSLFEITVKMKSIPETIGGTTGKSNRKHQISVISPDGSTFKALESIFKVSKHIDIERIWIANLTNQKSLMRAAEIYDAIVMDIDGAPETRWKEIIKFFYDHPGLENICIFYTPREHNSNIKSLFEKLEGTGWLHVYQKPLDIAAMILDLEKVWKLSDSK